MFRLVGIEMVVIDCVFTFATSALLRTFDTTSVGGVWRNVADIPESGRGNRSGEGGV